MRDISGDLGERLGEVEAERGRLQRQLEALVEREKILRSMLESEASRWGQQRLSPLIPMANGHSGVGGPYGKFVIEALSPGAPQGLTYLKKLATDMGVDFGDKSPGRVLHYALVGLKERGLVRRTDTDEWELIHEKDSEGQEETGGV